MKSAKVKIGLIGLGTVGSGVWEILRRHRDLLRRTVRYGTPIGRASNPRCDVARRGCVVGAP